MKDLLFKGVVFLAGGIVGSVVTWKLVKTKYEQIANEEIESMREYYDNKKKMLTEENAHEAGKVMTNGLDDGLKNPDKLTVQKIRDKVQELGYINDEIMSEKKEEVKNNMKKPYVVAPEETWEQDYPTITLTYYEGDGVLADEHDKIIGNADELVGEDFASHFGEYEDDSVYIRNDDLQIYYEILRDFSCHSEI